MTYEQGDLVLVPFPFTDLLGQKRRPALIISPNRFNTISDDVVLAALTSRIPSKLSPFQVSLEARDVLGDVLPRKSVVLLNKLLTVHKDRIVRNLARLTNTKLGEILGALSDFYSAR